MTIKEIFKLDVITNIQLNGGECFCVGGMVRDLFLNKQPKDIDIIVRKLPVKKLIEVLSSCGKVDLVGESFGVFKFKKDDLEIEFSLPRTDSKKDGKGHKAIEVQTDPFLPLEVDLKRRDLTINSMALDCNEVLIDPFNGLSDLMNKKISCTDKEAFIEDPLRILRAIQFAIRFGFSIEKETFKLIKQHKHLLFEITPERKLIELQKIIKQEKSINEVFSLLSLVDKEVFGRSFKTIIPIRSTKKLKDVAELIFTFVPINSIQDIVKLSRELTLDLDTSRKITGLFELNKLGSSLPRRIFNSIKVAKKKELILESSFVEDLVIVEKFKTNILPATINDLEVSGDELINLFGLQGMQIGEEKEMLISLIFEGRLLNKNKELINFLKIKHGTL